MNLTTILITMCLNAGINCENVTATFGEPPRGTVGTAQLFTSGSMAIVISSKIKNSEWRVRHTMLHEISHIVVYQQNIIEGTKPDPTHNITFKKACKLVTQANYDNVLACKRGEI
jgi:predicted SprT family Zn-dependent metalloprotease